MLPQGYKINSNIRGFYITKQENGKALGLLKEDGCIILFHTQEQAEDYAHHHAILGLLHHQQVPVNNLTPRIE